MNIFTITDGSAFRSFFAAKEDGVAVQKFFRILIGSPSSTSHTKLVLHMLVGILWFLFETNTKCEIVTYILVQQNFLEIFQIRYTLRAMFSLCLVKICTYEMLVARKSSQNLSVLTHLYLL